MIQKTREKQHTGVVPYFQLLSSYMNGEIFKSIWVLPTIIVIEFDDEIEPPIDLTNHSTNNELVLFSEDHNRQGYSSFQEMFHVTLGLISAKFLVIIFGHAVRVRNVDWHTNIDVIHFLQPDFPSQGFYHIHLVK
jgi:hypothetical protein